jgi:RND family efflux transporter MFP subunit
MKKALKIILPVLFLALGAAAAGLFISSKPTVSRQQQPRTKVAAVEVIAVSKGQVQTVVTAMGTVVPARQISLRCKVGGTVLETAEQFAPGGILEQGATVLRIDPRDFEIEVQKQESTLARAEADLRLEQGKQDVARQELDMLLKGSELKVQETELALRLPQLEKARAQVKSARAGLEKARLDLARTRVAAPFDSLVLEQEVHQGSEVRPQDKLATLVDTKEYHVRARVPLRELRLLDLQQEGGNQVQISSQSGAGEWTGCSLRLTGEVDDEARMATLLIQVEDPLGQETEPGQLLLDDFVHAEIQGRVLEEVYALPRKALREKDRVWVLEEGRLQIRQTEVLWRDAEQVYVRQGLSDGEQVVVSDISTPVQGMGLMLLEAGEDR